MLVITRKAGDYVQIGNDIFVHFFGINGSQMKIGIDAPDSVEIMRGELIDSRRDDNGRPIKDR
jgi:carbon storage regulator